MKDWRFYSILEIFLTFLETGFVDPEFLKMFLLPEEIYCGRNAHTLAKKKKFQSLSHHE